MTKRTIFVGLLLTAAILSGCAANTDQATDTKARQNTDTENRQESAAQGANIHYTANIYTTNAPSRPNVGDRGPNTTQPGAELDTVGAEADTQVKKASAGYNQAGIHIALGNVTVGNTTPTLTGTATGSGTQSQTSSPSAATTQDVHPAITIPANIVFGPGAPSAQGSTGSEGGSSNADQTNNQTTTTLTQELRATRDSLGEMTKALIDVANRLPTSQPAPR